MLFLVSVAKNSFLHFGIEKDRLGGVCPTAESMKSVGISMHLHEIHPLILDPGQVGHQGLGTHSPTETLEGLRGRRTSSWFAQPIQTR